jgi:hypothetical protein
MRTIRLRFLVVVLWTTSSTVKRLRYRCLWEIGGLPDREIHASLVVRAQDETHHQLYLTGNEFHYGIIHKIVFLTVTVVTVFMGSRAESRSMGCNPIDRVRLAALTEEIDAIYFADSLFWRYKQAHTRTEVAEYQWRQEQLEQIRGALARLGSVTDAMGTTLVIQAQ